MKRKILGYLFIFVTITLTYAQTNNLVSIYEGIQVQSVVFNYKNEPADTTLSKAYQRIVESEFRVAPQSQFDSFLASYYISKLKLLPFVGNAELSVVLSDQNMVIVGVNVSFVSEKKAEESKESAFANAKLLPVLYNSDRLFLTLKAAASEMVYSNDNAWFGQPSAMTTGNPLAEKPSGAGYTAWLEGFASAGLYGVYKVIP